MKTIVSEKFHNHDFERISKWHVLDSMMVTRKSSFARYAAGKDSDAKVELIYFKVDSIIYPLKRFIPLESQINLEDGSQITLADSESDLLLEVDKYKGKVRLYREIKK